MTGVLPGLEGYAGRDVSLGQWDTHPEVARAFARWAGVDGRLVLEPCAGIGNVAVALRDAGARVWAVEIDPARAALCSERGVETEVGDWLTMPPGQAVDVVAMNPPYEKNGETRFIERGLLWAPRVCAIVRLVAFASDDRAPFWRSVDVGRVAHLVPRPVFAGSSGMDEIVFVEVKRRAGVPPDGKSIADLEWLSWRINQ